jgi:hypothetical protein
MGAFIIELTKATQGLSMPGAVVIVAAMLCIAYVLATLVRSFFGG